MRINLNMNEDVHFFRMPSTSVNPVKCSYPHRNIVWYGGDRTFIQLFINSGQLQCPIDLLFRYVFLS